MNLPDPRDSEDKPYERSNTLCLNCGEDWGFHAGWSCSLVASGGKGKYSQLSPTHRFLTHDMVVDLAARGISPTPATPMTVVGVDRAAPPPKKEDAVYRFFAKVAPGNCACDMPRSQCQYHKE